MRRVLFFLLLALVSLGAFAEDEKPNGPKVTDKVSTFA
jgi:hypothetical protein